MTPCPHCGAPNPGIAVEVRGVYDGTLFDACEACDGTWHRWADNPDNTRLRAQAEKYMAMWPPDRQTEAAG